MTQFVNTKHDSPGALNVTLLVRHLMEQLNWLLTMSLNALPCTSADACSQKKVLYETHKYPRVKKVIFSLVKPSDLIVTPQK